MFCSKCGKANAEAERFCRVCGSELPNLSLVPTNRRVAATDSSATDKPAVRSVDPDQLTSKGIAQVFAGDGFLMVAVILSATQSSISSLLWLVLLIPAFYFFGKGVADVLEARQIRRRGKERGELNSWQANELPPARPSAIQAFEKVISGELTPAASVTERTTRNLS